MTRQVLGRASAKTRRSARPGMPARARRIILVLGVAFLLLTATGLVTYAVQRRIMPSPMARVSSASDRQTIFVLGDSFAENPYFQDQFPRVLSDRHVVIDGVGGATLEQERQRLLGRIDEWKSLVVILDGGLDDSSALRPIGKIVSQLDPGCGRWLYIEPPHSASQGAAGSDSYRRQSAVVAEVKRRWPTHFVSLIDPLRRAAGGTPADRESVANGWTPVSLRQDNDPIHLNAAGNRVLVEAIVKAIASMEQTAPPPCRGATKEQLQRAIAPSS